MILDYIGFDEPYKKLVNQGMIQGSSRFVYQYYNGSKPNLFQHGVLKDTSMRSDMMPIHVDVNYMLMEYCRLDELDSSFKKWRDHEYANAEFILEDGKYICGV